MRMTENMLTLLGYNPDGTRIARKGTAIASERGAGVGREADLHEAILGHCRLKGWIAFHGSMAHSTFRVPGEPDFLLLLPGGRMLMIECKTGKGKLSTDQQAIAAWAARLGHTVHVVRSMGEFMGVISDMEVEE